MENTTWTKFLNGELSISVALDSIKNALIAAVEGQLTISKSVVAGIYSDFKVTNNKLVVDIKEDANAIDGAELLEDKAFLTDLKSAVKKMDLEDLVFSGLPVAMNFEDWLNIVETYGLSGYSNLEIEGELIVVMYDRDIQEFNLYNYYNLELDSSLFIIANTIDEAQDEG